MGAPNSCARACARPGEGAIDQADVPRPLIHETHQYGPGAAAGADDDDRAGIGPPRRKGFQNALNIAETVMVVAVERAVGRNHHTIDGADPPRRRIDPVHDFEGRFLVGNRQVAAGEAQRRQGAQRRA